MNDSSSKYIVSVVLLSFGLLLLLSAVPWGEITGNTIKDFNLFEDLMPPREAVENADVMPDAELDMIADADEVLSGGFETAPQVTFDSMASDTVEITVPVYEQAPMVDGKVVIETYDATQIALPHFRQALTEVSSRRVRIAVLGDSYIEGDIFIQDLRSKLQERYGGSGVGFTPLYSEFPGFRRSMNLSSQGWKLHDIRSMSKRDSIRTLSGDYCKADSNIRTMIKGTTRLPHAGQWERTTFVFIAPRGASVTVSGDNGLTVGNTFDASDEPQGIVLDGVTSTVTIKASAPGIIGLGAYADALCGVQVDCMSVRGNSGMSLGRLNASLCTAMRQWADYDLIILEFGMNVVDSGRFDYTAYGSYMRHVVERLKGLYPGADILIMGVGDRGTKSSGTLASMPECTGMVNVQRELARQTGVCFWDTRAAMGGEGAAIEWRKKKLINADYIHLNHKGGAELASLFDFALNHAVSNE